MEEQPYRSLYRRYRPQRFSEVRGQDHVATALRNAVRRDHVSHAYLFSGPRGTGKTSTARILAKALNCGATDEGEPCGVCESCVAVSAGMSLDVHELDAASNNGVEAMRDLVSRAALATPGRHKVYIIDEVHMLSTPASNTLLKTLEEPPAHVVFVLATTDPHKVLPTIVSRTQHFEFHLLAADVLAGLLSDVQADAGLGLGADVLAVALKRGNGSARDALSALDQLVAAEGTSTDDEVACVDEVIDALCESDAPGALLGLGRAIASGRDPIRLALDLIEQLRQGFLAKLAPQLVELGDDEHGKVGIQAERLGTAGVVRAMEILGHALVDMRDFLDPRIALELALVRLTHPASDATSTALLERIERLESRLAEAAPAAATPAAAAPAAAAPASSAPASSAPASSAPAASAPAAATPAAAAPASSAPASSAPASSAPASSAPADAARAPALGATRVPQSPPRQLVARLAPPPPLPGATAGAPTAGVPTAGVQGADRQMQASAAPSRDDLVEAWGDHVLDALRPRARSLFRAGRFVEAHGGLATFALPDPNHRARAESVREEVEKALSSHFSSPVRLRLVVDDSPDSGPGVDGARQGDEEMEDLPASVVYELPEADTGPPSAQAMLFQAFPGAEWIKEEVT